MNQALWHPIDVLFDRLEQLAFLNHLRSDHMNDFFVHVRLNLEIHLVKHDDRYQHIDVVILFLPIVVI
jgi:hypothetical protein